MTPALIRGAVALDAAELREIANRMAEIAPATSVKIAALATELELRIKQKEALHVW